MKFLELEKATLADLRQIAREMNIPNASRMKKENLILAIRQVEAEREGLEVRGGILEILPEGIGFLRKTIKLARTMSMSRRLSYGAMTCVWAIWSSASCVPPAKPNVTTGW